MNRIEYIEVQADEKTSSAHVAHAGSIRHRSSFGAHPMGVADQKIGRMVFILPGTGRTLISSHLIHVQRTSPVRQQASASDHRHHGRRRRSRHHYQRPEQQELPKMATSINMRHRTAGSIREHWGTFVHLVHPRERYTRGRYMDQR